MRASELGDHAFTLPSNVRVAVENDFCRDPWKKPGVKKANLYCCYVFYIENICRLGGCDFLIFLLHYIVVTTAILHMYLKLTRQKLY